MFSAGQVFTRRRGKRGLFELGFILHKHVNYSYYVTIILFACFNGEIGLPCNVIEKFFKNKEIS